MSEDPLKVFVGGLSKQCAPPKLKEHMQHFGLDADEVFMPRNRTLGLSIGFATLLDS